jgi:hypothetical protein
MATIVSPETFTSYQASLSGPVPGDAATGHIQRSVVDYVEALAPMDTPLLKMISKGKSYNQQKIEWITGADVEHTATLNEALDTSETDVTLDSGQAARVQVYQTIAVYELDANSEPDFSTREIMWVTAVNTTTDVLTVVRAQGGTSAGSFSDGAFVEILATAVPEGEDFVVSPDAFGTFYHNFFQLVQKGARITEEANVTPNWEFQNGNHIARIMKRVGMRAKRELEKSIVQGGKQQGTNASGASQRPGMMGGINDFVVASGDVTDLNGRILTPYDIEQAGANLWDSVGDAGAKRLLMSMTSARMLDGILNKYRQGDLDDTNVNLTFRKFETRFGTFEIVPTRWIPEGIILGINSDELSIHPYEGMDWTEKEHSTDGAYIWRSIYGRFTLKCTAPETFFKLHSYSTNLEDYGRVI